MQKHHVLAASRPWYDNMAARLRKATGDVFYRVATPEELKSLDLDILQPRYVFVPHWSWILPESVWSRFETVIFHMTDLPFGRGGSPLQNLIARGFTETRITALRCATELDAGPVYAKTSLSLLGNAEEIFLRAAAQMEMMIISILQTNPEPVPQQGDPVFFARRFPREGDISGLLTLDAIYNHIRMLDATGYPSAFLESGPLRLEFKRAALRWGKIEADVTITVKDNSDE
jgi:methionyl-tRNA formyltransferase